MAAYNQDKADKFIASYKGLSNSGEKNEFAITPSRAAAQNCTENVTSLLASLTRAKL